MGEPAPDTSFTDKHTELRVYRWETPSSDLLSNLSKVGSNEAGTTLVKVLRIDLELLCQTQKERKRKAKPARPQRRGPRAHVPAGRNGSQEAPPESRARRPSRLTQNKNLYKDIQPKLVYLG